MSGNWMSWTLLVNNSLSTLLVFLFRYPHLLEGPLGEGGRGREREREREGGWEERN